MNLTNIKINFSDLEFDVCLGFPCSKNDWKHVLVENYEYTLNEGDLWDAIESSDNRTEILEFIENEMEKENPSCFDEFMKKHFTESEDDFESSYDEMLYDWACDHVELIYNEFEDDLYDYLEDYAIDAATEDIKQGKIDYEEIDE